MLNMVAFWEIAKEWLKRKVNLALLLFSSVLWTALIINVQMNIFGCSLDGAAGRLALAGVVYLILDKIFESRFKY